MRDTHFRIPETLKPLLWELKSIVNILYTFARNPRLSLRILRRLPFILHVLHGVDYGRRWVPPPEEQILSDRLDSGSLADAPNPLKSYFDSHKEGRGVWKWVHYFEIYHRHFSKFVGREVHVLEIGVYSGGSLQMWTEYFGPKCRVYGVDIEEACAAYQDDRTKIIVGDQSDRRFWKRFKEENPAIDILIDDGSHEPEHQIVTLEEMLPHLRPGGVYLCEDVHGEENPFNSYVHGLAASMNSSLIWADQGKGLTCNPTHYQAAIHSIHLYPFAIVIEKTKSPREEFTAPKHGTEWQPFLE